MAVAVCIYSNAVFLIVQSAYHFVSSKYDIFLNQVLSGHIVLEYDFCNRCMCLCAPLGYLITSVVMWHDMNSM